MSDYNDAMRELQHLQEQLANEEITNREYERRDARVRREYGLRGWGGTHHE